MKESTGQEHIKSIKEIIYELKRFLTKKKLTRYLGKVIEEEDKLICHVKKNMFKRGKKDHSYSISCCGISLKDKELARKYNLDKKIVYIIENIDFKHNRIFIFGSQDCDVIIKNCDFRYDTAIKIDGKCTLENICIKNYGTYIYTNIRAKELIISDTTIINNSTDFHSNKLRIVLNAEQKLEINNSTIGDKNAKVQIDSNEELAISNCKVIGREVWCLSKKTIFDHDSIINATKETTIKSRRFNEIKINSPVVVHNGKTLKQDRPIILKGDYDDSEIEIIKLIQVLKQIKEKADLLNNKTLKKCQDSLNNKPIRKVLSRRITNN